MKDYSTYRKELDPFSKDFDPTKALAECDIPEPSTSSINDFEQELMGNKEAEDLVVKLQVNFF
jgi:hypothetical protein